MRLTASRRPSLVRRMILTYILSLLVTMLVFLGGLAFYLQWQTESGLETEGSRISAWLSGVVSEPLWNLDLRQLRTMTTGLIAHSAVDHVTVVDPDGKVIFEVGASAPGSPVYASPILRSGQILGQLVLTLSRREAVAETTLASGGILVFGVLIGLGAFLVPWMFRRRMGAPLLGLSDLVERYANGEYRSLDQLRMPYREFDSIGQALSTMGRSIREQMEQWQLLNDRLELAVAERTQDLERTLEHLRRTQDSLVRSEKLASLGKLVAVFAHELNTPLGVIGSSAQTLNALSDDMARFLIRDGVIPEDLITESIRHARELSVAPTRTELRRWKREHAEIPAFELVVRLIEDYGLWPMRERLPSAAAELPESSLQYWEALCARVRSIVFIESAVQRAAGVVKSLRIYLKEERDNPPAEFSPARELDRILALLGGRMRDGIQLVREYEPGLLAWGNAESLGQVWMNLMTNALYSLERSGTLTLRAFASGVCAVVEIQDSGPGIPPEIRDRIFDQFFTTKPEGEGLGLGLDICRQIVEAQRGSIGFESEPGRTVFRVELPLSVSAGTTA